MSENSKGYLFKFNKSIYDFLWDQLQICISSLKIEEPTRTHVIRSIFNYLNLFGLNIIN